MSTTELCFRTATDLAQAIRTKELSAVEVMEAHLAQIDRVNHPSAVITITNGRDDRDGLGVTLGCALPSAGAVNPEIGRPTDVEDAYAGS